MTAADARARAMPVGGSPVIGVPGGLVLPGGAGIVVMRAMMGPERIPHPAHEEGQGQGQGERVSGVGKHPGNLITPGGPEQRMERARRWGVQSRTPRGFALFDP